MSGLSSAKRSILLAVAFLSVIPGGNLLLQSLGANIVDPLEAKPWGLRQFTVQDLDGNLFHIHHG